MLQAPTTEGKTQTESARTALLAPEPERELHPRTSGTASAWSDGLSSSGDSRDPSPLRQRAAGLQKSIGNQAVLRLFSRPSSTIQTKLTINEPGDEYEQEADRVADQVMRMADTQRVADVSSAAGSAKLQRKCACDASGEKCESCTEKHEGGLLQRKESGILPGPGIVPPIVHDVLRSPGKPLDPLTRAFMEPRLGYDFGAVRIHADSRAAESAKAVSAHAYTVDQHIVFASGRYNPQSSSGRRLLAHELTHVAQNRNATSALRREADNDNRPMTRAEEIKLSRRSPGEIATITEPLTLSLYNFAIDDATPKPEHRELLAQLGGFLAKYAAKTVRVILTGHADSSGPEFYNLDLSRRRATSVRDILQPLVSGRIGLHASGEWVPIVSNDTVAGRSRNRRVDVRIVNVLPPRKPDPKRRPPDKREPPQPPKPTTDDDKKKKICDEFPRLCDALPWTIFLLPLICVIEPELCLCLLDPLACLPGGGGGGGQPPEKKKPDDHRTPSVIFVPDVRQPNTPTGMNDRVNNRSWVKVTAFVVNPPPPPQNIIINVDGAGPQEGEVTINNLPEVAINATTDLEILGSTLTSPVAPLSPHLQLAAWFNGTLVGYSNTFAVSVILQDWKIWYGDQMSFPTGHELNVRMNWGNDAGGPRSELGNCFYCELVGVDEELGGMIGMGVGGVQDCEGDPGLGEVVESGDTHGTENRWLVSPGFQRLHQLYQIRDLRSRSDWAPARNSGYKIERTYERDPAERHCWHLVVDKQGVPVTVGGMSSGAGAGTARAEFRRLNCDPAPKPKPPESEDGSGTGGAVRVDPRVSGRSTGIMAGSFTYGSGLRHWPAVGATYQIEIFFQSQGKDCVASVPFRVSFYDASNRDAEVPIVSAGPSSLNVAPVGDPPLILDPGVTLSIPRSLLP